MRDVTYFVAASLDGFIARLDESINWLFMDDDYGFDEFYRSVDTVVMGRRTFEISLNFIEYPYAGKRAHVFSRTLNASPHPDAEVTSEDPARVVKKLKSQPGGRIWVAGGGGVASALMQAGLIDELVVTIHPITLGQGVPLFERHGTEQRWVLYASRVFHNGLLQATWRRTPREAA